MRESAIVLYSKSPSGPAFPADAGSRFIKVDISGDRLAPIVIGSDL
jgi:hypothetical protein